MMIFEYILSMMFGLKPMLHFLMSKSMRQLPTTRVNLSKNGGSRFIDDARGHEACTFRELPGGEETFPSAWQCQSDLQVAVAQEAKNLEKFLGDMEAHIKAATLVCADCFDQGC